MNKIYVIGIGYKPLDKKAREIILKSSVILANEYPEESPLRPIGPIRPIKARGFPIIFF